MGVHLLWRATDRYPAGSLEFDVMTSETLTYSSTVTEFPVESGANISDHVRENLDSVTLDVFVSNTPLDGLNRVGGLPRGFVGNVPIPLPVMDRGIDSISSAINAIGSAIRGPKDPESAQVLIFPRQFSATQETHLALRRIKDQRILLWVISRDWNVDNMILESVSAPRTPAEGGGARFTLQFKQIRIVETMRTAFPIPAEPRGKPIVKTGKEPDKETDPKKMGSVADKLAEKFGVYNWLGIGK